MWNTCARQRLRVRTTVVEAIILTSRLILCSNSFSIIVDELINIQQGSLSLLLMLVDETTKGVNDNLGLWKS